jgi:hypothetical protein
MADTAEALPRPAEPEGATLEAPERHNFHAFVSMLILVQVLWLMGLALGVYELVT